MASGLIGGVLSLFFKPPPKSLADAELGERVVVRGKIIPRDVLESPLTGERCVYFSYSVDVWRQAVQGIGSEGFWRNVERDEAITEFYIQAGSERLIVAPQSAKVTRARGPDLIARDYRVDGRKASEMLLLAGDEIEVSGRLAKATDLFDDARDYRALPHRYMLVADEGGKIEIRLLTDRGESASRQ